MAVGQDNIDDNKYMCMDMPTDLSPVPLQRGSAHLAEWLQRLVASRLGCRLASQTFLGMWLSYTSLSTSSSPTLLRTLPSPVEGEPPLAISLTAATDTLLTTQQHPLSLLSLLLFPLLGLGASPR